MFHKHQQSYFSILPIVALGYRPFTGRHLHLKRFQHLRCPVQSRFNSSISIFLLECKKKKTGVEGKKNRIVHTFSMCTPHSITVLSSCSITSLFFSNISSVTLGSSSSGILGIVSKISPSMCSNVLQGIVRIILFLRIFLFFLFSFSLLFNCRYSISTNHSTLAVNLSKNDKKSFLY